MVLPRDSIYQKRGTRTRPPPEATYARNPPWQGERKSGMHTREDRGAPASSLFHAKTSVVSTPAVMKCCARDTALGFLLEDRATWVHTACRLQRHVECMRQSLARASKCAQRQLSIVHQLISWPSCPPQPSAGGSSHARQIPEKATAGARSILAGHPRQSKALPRQAPAWPRLGGNPRFGTAPPD